MFNKFLSKMFLLITCFIIILNSIEIFGEDIVITKSNQQNISVESSAEKLIARTPPKLLGIFADGVNDSTNILNKDYGTGLHSENETQSLPELAREKLVPQNIEEINDNKSVDQYLNDTIESNQTQNLHLCRRQDFVSENYYNNQLDRICLLGDSQPNSYSLYNDLKPKGIIPNYFYIPGGNMSKDGVEIIESVEPTSYIAMMVHICSEPNGKVLIYDEGSKQQLLSFNNLGTARFCNHWENNFESFVSDSAKIRVEYREPDDSKLKENTYTFINENEQKYDGHRQFVFDKFELFIRYFEIKFIKNEQLKLDPLQANETYEAIYVPNSVVTYILKSSDSQIVKKTFSIGLNITIEMLDIDIDSGDFVLIGPGDNPTHRELSKAQIIATNIRNEEDAEKRIFVNADSAYIRLVTHNSMKKSGTALRFTWNPPNNTFSDLDEDKVSNRIRDSAVQMCVIGNSCSKFKTTFEPQFKTELVHIANDYLFNKDHDITNLVSEKSVIMFNFEEGNRIRADKSELFCQLNVAIADGFDLQWPMVSHNTLQYIFFRGSDHRIMRSFGTVRVTDCSHESISFWKMILPIIVILIVSIALMLIAWRYQYNNWIHIQRSENSKYMNAPNADPNEDILYSKGGPKVNPAFVEIDSPTNIRKNNTIERINIDSVKQKATKTPNLLNQISVSSEQSITSSKRLSSVKESPEFVKNLWQNPGTSEQNSYDFDEIDGKLEEISSEKFKSNTYSDKTETFPSQIPITGLNGTQHESLRSYPRSVLRRPTIVENEYIMAPEHNQYRRSSKVQFELPGNSNKYSHDNQPANC